MCMCHIHACAHAWVYVYYMQGLFCKFGLENVQVFCVHIDSVQFHTLHLYSCMQMHYLHFTLVYLGGGSSSVHCIICVVSYFVHLRSVQKS